MKRAIEAVSRSGASDTPLPNALKGKKCRQEGLCGTPVEGLTGMPVDTPESQQRERIIPDTTQRKLEGFCLNTPLTLSQAQAAETPTLGREQQQQHGKVQDEQQQAAAAGGGQATRHRLANISNLPPSPMYTAHKSPSRDEFAWDEQARAMECNTASRQQQQQQHVARQRRRHGVTFLPNLLSPPATLPGFSVAAGLAATYTPYPPSGGSSGANVGFSCPGSAGGCFGSEDDFVLHTSQSYCRSSQPAISPSVAAGLSAAPEEEQEEEDLQQQQPRQQQQEDKPFTTPSQDSREPVRQSHSNITFSNATSVDQPEQQVVLLGQQQQQQPACSFLPPAGPSAAAAEPGGFSRFNSNSSSRTEFSLGLGGAASCTPGDGLAMLLGGEAGELEETTTPELEQIGIGSQDPGGSQLSAGVGTGTNRRAGAAAGGVAAGAAAGAAGGSAGAGSSRGVVVCEEVTTKQVLFPIFRPKSCRKCVILVRHGESTYNKLDAHGKQWSDPDVFDAPLTHKGRQQAQAAHKELSRQLEKHSHLGTVLWLSSPLTRALETMMLAYPDLEQLAQGLPGSSGAQHPSIHRVMVLSMISEHCATTGDVGRPASHLKSRFPALTSQLSELPEQWWFNPCPQNPNCAQKGLFGRKESVDEMRRRVSEFSRWLRNRPEQLVVAFGHSTFWKYFSNSKSKMRNCEVLQLWW